MRFAANNQTFSSTQFIPLKNNEWYEKQKIAGKVVAACLKTVKTLIEKETQNLSLKDLEAECEKIISDAKCIPTFKGYKGFPGAICTSVNKQLVHGAPTDYVLQPGDVLAVDLGATFEGVIGDAAITCIYGEPKNQEHVKLLETCQGALYAGIKAMAVGKQLGCIGAAINKYVKNSNFSLITKYGGHGLMEGLHSQPFVPNKSRSNEGIRIQPGLCIAIEPMLVMGINNTRTYVKKDNWTVCGMDISSHYEHSVFVTENSVEIMTKM
jgi:methionyl aminopeptidase